MRWFAVHHELATNAKWLDLDLEERGAWITLLTIAAANDPRGTIRDRMTAVALLRREMQRAARPAADLVAALVDGEWLDEDPESGLLTFHDFDLWQLRVRKPSDWPEAIRERVARHRKKKENQKEEDRTDTGQVQVTPGNALPPCPACGATVNLIEGSKGKFYGCSAFPNCSWKSNAPPPAPTPPWVQSDADRAEIAKAHLGAVQ